MSNLELATDGSVTGGGASYYPNPFPDAPPISVVKNDDGSYFCSVTEAEYEYDEGIEANIPVNTINSFTIYPVGVVGSSLFGEDEEFLRSVVYIEYVQIDGGVLDAAFYKDDSAGAMMQGMSTYTTKSSSMPEFAFDYPDNWSVKSEELQSNYEWDVLQNARGVEISYYFSDYGFGSQYYGGNKVMDYVHITKVSDSDFVPVDFNGQSYSSLGKYVVAKLKVYAYEDGMLPY